MINCPKCGFLQPEDQYCASCGINMEKWTAPKLPLWKKIAGNWMFQLSVLFVVIFVVILSDSFKEKESQTIAEKPRLRRKSITPPEERERLNEPVESKVQASSSQPSLKKTVGEKDSNVNAQPLGSLEAAKKIQKQATFNQVLSAQLLFVPKNNIASILNSSTKVASNAGTLHKKSFTNYRKKKQNWDQLASSSTDFVFNEPASIFYGEDHSSGKGLGFYFQVNVYEVTSGNISFEVRGWSDLKLNEEGGTDAFSFEVTMKRKHALVLTNFAPAGLEFNEEEVTFVDGSRVLSPLNSAQFIEGYGDFLLHLEFR